MKYIRMRLPIAVIMRNEMNNKNHDAIVILCSGLCLSEDINPFSTSQWSTFAEKLLKANKTPADILDFNDDIQKELELDANEISRIKKLLGRAASLAFEIESLNRMGIYIITIADEQYPSKIKQVLSKKSPPLFYYCGNLDLLNNDLVGFVGSRNASSDDIDYTKRAVKHFLNKGYSIVSGGAKGVDKTATEFAIDNGKFAVEVLADSLTRRIKDPKIYKAIIENRLLLLSQSEPSEHFKIGLAMQRNKYIYSLSKFTIVVKSDYKKGGTWSGAKEAIDKKYTDVCCWDNIRYFGNQELIKLRASKIDENFNIIKNNIYKNKPTEIKQLSFFDSEE